MRFWQQQIDRISRGNNNSAFSLPNWKHFEPFSILGKACFSHPDAATYHYQLGELSHLQNPLVLKPRKFRFRAEELMMESYRKATDWPDVRDFGIATVRSTIESIGSGLEDPQKRDQLLEFPYTFGGSLVRRKAHVFQTQDASSKRGKSAIRSHA